MDKKTFLEIDALVSLVTFFLLLEALGCSNRITEEDFILEKDSGMVSEDSGSPLYRLDGSSSMDSASTNRADKRDSRIDPASSNETDVARRSENSDRSGENNNLDNTNNSEEARNPYGNEGDPVYCNNKECTTPENSPLRPCCTDNDTCGGGIGDECQEWEMPGDLDTSCPNHRISPRGVSLNGCCTPDNMCGVMSSVGLGCIDRIKLASYAGGPLEQIRCGENNYDDDGGTN